MVVVVVVVFECVLSFHFIFSIFRSFRKDRSIGGNVFHNTMGWMDGWDYGEWINVSINGFLYSSIIQMDLSINKSIN